VALVRTDVSEVRIASIMRVIRIGELGTLAVKEPKHAAISVLSKTTRRNIPEDGILREIQ
jgi:hypothetical protein